MAQRGCKGGCGQAYASDLCVMMSRIMGFHIKGMRWQIVVLTETVRLLPPNEGSNGFKDRQLNDSFDAPHRRRAHSHRLYSKWNYFIKDFEFLEFRESYNPDVFEE